MFLKLHIPLLIMAAIDASPHHDFHEMERTLSIITGCDLHEIVAFRVSNAGRKFVYGPELTNAQAAFAAARRHFERHPDDQGFIRINPANCPITLPAEVEFVRVSSGKQSPIAMRKWLLVDLDPVRPSSTNSSDSQLIRAAVVAQHIVEVLTEAGWQEPVVASSGNGIHLLFRIELPADDDSTALVKRCLSEISKRFRTDEVHIDTKVYDPPRLVRWYGSVNRKGPSTPNNPQRRSALLSVPETIGITPRGKLEEFGGTKDETVCATTSSNRLSHLPTVTLSQVLGLLRDVRPSGEEWMACCPAHCDRRPSLSVKQADDGKILLRCHAGCGFKKIVKSVGLKESQLFGKRQLNPTEVRNAPQTEVPTNDVLAKYATECQTAITPECLGFLANQLGVATRALQMIDVGWSQKYQAWTIPERRSDGGIIGIQLRGVDNSKWCVKGSHRGLILPIGCSAWTGRVFIPEGPTDVVAFLSYGVNAIGRPSAACAPGLDRFLKARPAIAPFIVGENDQKADGSWPGLEGAKRCAEQLAKSLDSPVAIVLPPGAVKDIRDWVQTMNRNGGAM